MIPIKYSNIQKVIRTEPGHSVYEILFQFKVNNNLYDYVELISNLVFVHYTAQLHLSKNMSHGFPLYNNST